MTTIKLRRGLSTAFSTNNPVLAAGEPAFATDTGILKIGDGTTAYNSLPSIGASPDLSNYVQKTDYASTSATGVVKVDGSTVTIDANGVISAPGSTPSNMVTTDTTQTITGAKTFSLAGGTIFSNSSNTNGDTTLGFYDSSSYLGGMKISTTSNTPYRYNPGIQLSRGVYNTKLYANSSAAYLTTDEAGIYIANSSTGLYVARNGSSLTYNGNNVLDSSCVDGTTVTYDSSTGKISANVTVADFTGADGTNAGVHGLVPAPTATDNVKYLRGDGSWATPTNTTYSAFTGTDGSSAGSAGLVPAPATTDAGKFLCADGSWGTPSSSAPSNMVTTNTTQDISADKTFIAQAANSGTKFSSVTNPTGAHTLVGEYNAFNSRAGIYLYTASTLSSVYPTITFASKGQDRLGICGSGSTNSDSVLSIKAPYVNIGGSSYDRTTNSSYAGLRVNGFGNGITYNNNNLVQAADITKIVKLTQAAYDNLATKDANTFYVIIPSST